MMDILSFEKVEDTSEYKYICAKTIINGVALLDKVTDIELPYAIIEGYPGIAGAYNHQIAQKLYGQIFCEKIYELYNPHTTLLTCECFEDGCWSLLGECKDTGDEVVWRNFRQNHRDKWDYAALGEFHFDKRQYNNELVKLKSFWNAEAIG